MSKFHNNEAKDKGRVVLRKKPIVIFGSVLIVYILAVVGYFIVHKMNTLDESLRGTSLNPFNVLDEAFVLKSETFFDLTGIALLVEPIVLVFVLLLIYMTSLNEKLLQLTSKMRWKVTRFIVYTFMVGMILHVARLPFSWMNNLRWRDIPPGELPVGTWFANYVGDVFSTWALAALILGFFYICMHYFKKRWWLAGWFISIPIIYLLFGNSSLSNVNGLERLEQSETVAAIEAFVQEQELELEGVYTFEASQWTDTLEVSVHMSSGEVQVVVWDTVLQALTTEELVYIVASEFHSMEQGPSALQIVILIALSYVAFFVSSHIIARFVSEEEYGQLNTVPISWAALLLAMFIIMPVLNNFDRDEQLHVDLLALEAIDQPTIAVEALKKMMLHQPVQIHESLLFDVFGTSRVGLMERLENVSE